MQTYTDTGRQENLETAFIAAIEQIADMDDSVSDGIATVAPDVVLWMLEMEKPALMNDVERYGVRDELLSLIAEYALLRRYARKIRVKNPANTYFDASNGMSREPPISCGDLLAALNDSDSVVSLAFRTVFDSVYLMVQERLETVGAIEWGDPEPAPQADASREEPLSEHYKEYIGSKSIGDDPDYSDDPLEDALQWTADLLDRMDTGRYLHLYSAVYTSVLWDWLQQDRRLLSQTIEREGLFPLFCEAMTHFINERQQAEQLWHRLGQPLRALLDKCWAPRLVKDLIAAMRDADEDLSLRDVHPGDVYDMLCRRLHPDRNSCKAQVIEHSPKSALVDSIRSNAMSMETAYLVNLLAIPELDGFFYPEKQCIVVRLPEVRLQLLDELTRDTGLESIISHCTDHSNWRLNLTPNHAFWAPQEQLWPLMFRFRTCIPVLYIFDEVCVSVAYAFNHFVDLKRIAEIPGRHLNSATLSNGDWTYAAKRYTSTLPDGTQVKPAILTSVRDLTKSSSEQ